MKLKKSFKMTLAVMLMSCMAYFGVLAVTDIAFAYGDDPEVFFCNVEYEDLPINGDSIYSDEERVYSVKVQDQPVGSVLEIDAYTEYWDEEQGDYEKEYFYDGWEYDENDQILTVNGEALCNMLQNLGSMQFTFTAKLLNEYEDVIVSKELPIEVFESVEEYDFQSEYFKDNWKMLVSDEGYIFKQGYVYIHNRQYPFGQDFEYFKTNIESDSDCVVITDGISDGEDCWKVKAIKNGTAELTITYKIPETEETDTFSIHVEVAEGYHDVQIDTDSSEEISYALPGASINMIATGEYYSNNDYEEFDYEYEWHVDEGEEYATIDVDENDSSRATLKINENIDIQDENTVVVRVVLKDANNNEELADNTHEFLVKSEYDDFYVSDYNSDALVGESQKVSVVYKHYDKSHPQGVENTNWTVSHEVDPAGAATIGNLNNDPNGNNYQITRISPDFFEITFTATNKEDPDESYVRSLYFQTAPSNDLSNYHIKAYDENDDEIYNKTYVNEGGKTYPTFKVADDLTDEVFVRPDAYTLKIEKEIIDQNGKISYKEIQLKDGFEANEDGTATYRLTATAKVGSGYLGSCQCFFDLGSRMSLNGFNAHLYFNDPWDEPNGLGEKPMREYYAVTLDELIDLGEPSVFIDDMQLEKDTDYTLKYVPESNEDDPSVEGYDSITEPGTYVCRIKGTGVKGSGYYGTSASVAIQVVASQDDLDVLQEASEYANRVNSILDEEIPLDEMKECVASLKNEYNELSDEVRNSIPKRIKDKLDTAEKCVEFAEIVRKIDPAKPDTDAVARAKAVYDSIPDDFKDFIDKGDLAIFKAAEKKIADDEAEKKARQVKTVTINVKTVNAAAVNAAVKKAGGSDKYVTKFVLGKKVKGIKSGAFTTYKKATTIEVKTKKLTKKSVKKSLKGSAVKTIKVKIGSKKVNKKFKKKYKKIFTKKNVGKKVKVR